MLTAGVLPTDVGFCGQSRTQTCASVARVGLVNSVVSSPINSNLQRLSYCLRVTGYKGESMGKGRSEPKGGRWVGVHGSAPLAKTSGTTSLTHIWDSCGYRVIISYS